MRRHNLSPVFFMSTQSWLPWSEQGKQSSRIRSFLAASCSRVIASSWSSWPHSHHPKAQRDSRLQGSRRTSRTARSSLAGSSEEASKKHNPSSLYSLVHGRLSSTAMAITVRMMAITEGRPICRPLMLAPKIPPSKYNVNRFPTTSPSPCPRDLGGGI